ncbi:hypothetical protein IFM89_020169 [Coptis chinensis]|uniref:Uncharacterized protein n=1 Tax=Coptis chinensis TaxID=261450 RepID=A0A835H447_9MAGN|nr:hypothetical protein IFM89_020169 [Coptis chinensis]
MDMGWGSMNFGYSNGYSQSGRLQQVMLWDDCYIEKRRVFLSSYQFCRKTSLADRIKTSFIGVTKRFIIWFRLRSPRKVSVKVRYRCFGRRKFHRLVSSRTTFSSW